MTLFSSCVFFHSFFCSRLLFLCRQMGILPREAFEHMKKFCYLSFQITVCIVSLDIVSNHFAKNLAPFIERLPEMSSLIISIFKSSSRHAITLFKIKCSMQMFPDTRLMLKSCLFVWRKLKWNEGKKWNNNEVEKGNVWVWVRVLKRNIFATIFHLRIVFRSIYSVTCKVHVCLLFDWFSLKPTPSSSNSRELHAQRMWLEEREGNKRKRGICLLVCSHSVNGVL